MKIRKLWDMKKEETLMIMNNEIMGTEDKMNYCLIIT
jgi:hypothetical protein